ncbi:MAG: caspase family protein [Lewinellaceae bacterium]|nr:caspase family protein [Lewinellaceae bacterium]
MKKHVLLILFGGFWLCGIAQPADTTIAVLWDSIYHADRAEVVNDVIILPSRNIVVVGSALDAGNNRDGLFILLDTSGRVLIRKYIGKALRDDVFWGAAEAEDGTFYLVGHVYAGPEFGNQAWIVRLNDAGEEIPMPENYFGGQGDDRFLKIVWTNSNRGLIAATKAASPPGYLPLYQVNGNTVTEMASLGDGMVEDMVVMEKNPASSGVWLAGNARKSDITRKGDVWICKVDDRGAPLITDKLSGRYYKRLRGGSGDFSGHLRLAGEVYGSITGDSDGWIGEYVPGQKKQEKPDYFGEDYNDYANFLYLTPLEDKWVVMSNPSTQGVSVMVYKGGNLKERAIFDISRQSRFDLVKLLQKKINTYLLVGTGFDASRKSEAIRITSIYDKETFSWRGRPVIEVSDIQFSDDSGNQTLEADEYGAVRFRLKNTGSVPLQEGVIRAELIQKVNGLTVKRPYQVIPFLPAGGEKICAVSVYGEKDLDKGTATLRITVESSSMEPKSYTAEVPCRTQKTPTPDGVTINYVTPRLVNQSGSNVREFEATDKMYPVETTINTSNGQARVTNARIFVNRTPLNDQKAQPQLSDPIAHADQRRFTYYFKSQVPLEEGRNVIYIEFDGYQSDSIVVYFAPKLPNLHVLAIGVPADDLKYTTKDARDFADAISAQNGLGLFNRINVQVYANYDSTTNNALSIAFQSLRDAAFNGQIKPNDFIVVFLSSHGDRGKDGRFYLQSSGCNPKYESTMFDYEYYISRYLNPINCKHKILFVDACHSGAARGQDPNNPEGGSKGPGQQELAKALFQANTAAEGMAIFTSCSSNELSYEHSSWQNGAFTEALLEAFTEGKAFGIDQGSWLKTEGQYTPEPDDIITIDELKAFLETRVPALVQEKFNPNFTQHPEIKVDAQKMNLSFIILK